MADAILVVPPAIIDVSEDVEPYITVEGGKSHIGHVKPKNFRAGDTVRTTFINISPAAANLKKDGVVQTATATGDNYIEFTATADLGGSMDEVTFIAVQQNWEPDPSYEEIRFILEPATNTIVGSTHFHANAIDYPDKRIATGDAAGFNATPADLQFDWTTILGSNIEMIPRAGGTVKGKDKRA